MRAVQPLPRRHSRGEARKAVRGLRPGDLQRSGEPAPADALLRGGDCPAVWDAAVARQQAYAPAGVAPLTLPRFDPQPEVLRVRFPALGLPELAEAMLDEGILRESDWTGDLRASLNAGIARWVSELLDGESLQHVRLGLVWNNSIPETLDVDLWAEANPWHSERHPVGLLAIRSGEPVELFLGAKTLELEAVQKGLGFQVFGTVCDALPKLIGVPIPAYALSEVRKYALLRVMRIPAAEFVGGFAMVDEEEFLGAVPLEACEGLVRPGILKEALRRELPDWARDLVARAVELHVVQAVSRETYRCDAHLLHRPEGFQYAFEHGFAPKWFSLSLRWSSEDHVGTIARHYRRQMELMEGKHGPGTVSNLAWCRAWQPHHPRELRRAVRHWKNAVTIALRGCRLAELLHTENPHA